MEGLEYIKSVLENAGYKVLENAVEAEQKPDSRAEKGDSVKKREKTEDKHAILVKESVAETSKTAPVPAAGVEKESTGTLPTNLYDLMLKTAIERSRQIAVDKEKPHEAPDMPIYLPVPAKEPCPAKPRKPRSRPLTIARGTPISEEERAEIAEVSNVSPNKSGGSYCMRVTFPENEFLMICRHIKEQGFDSDREYVSTIIAKDLNTMVRGARRW